MLLRPVTLEHGEHYGKLTVLEKVGKKYRVGCSCGFSGLFASASRLMKGKVKECTRCRDPKGLQARL